MLVLFLLLLALVVLNFKTLFDNSRYAAINTALSLQNDSIMIVNSYLTNELKRLQRPCSVSINPINLAQHSAKYGKYFHDTSIFRMR
jgi:hypothetical protein